MKIIKALVTVPVAVMTLFLVSSCASIPVEEEAMEMRPVHSIVVMPTVVGAEAATSSQGVTELLEAGALVLDALLADQVKELRQVRVLSRSQQESMIGNASGNNLAQARETGRRLDADGVILVTINRYAQRDGTAYSVTQPASVAFDYRLVETATGQVLCSGVFDETQQTVLENILTLSKATGRGIRWLTAEELAAAGVKEKLGNCQYLQ